MPANGMSPSGVGSGEYFGPFPPLQPPSFTLIYFAPIVPIVVIVAVRWNDPRVTRGDLGGLATTN